MYDQVINKLKEVIWNAKFLALTCDEVTPIDAQS